MKTHETKLQELQKKHEWAERMRRNAIIALESAAEARDHWDREAARLAVMIAEAEAKPETPSVYISCVICGAMKHWQRPCDVCVWQNVPF
jgi:hypothetical protein